MIPPSVCSSSRQALGAADAAFFAAARALRQAPSAAAREVSLRCARAFVLAELADLLLLEQFAQRLEDTEGDEGLVAQSTNGGSSAVDLKDSLVTAGLALHGPADGIRHCQYCLSTSDTRGWIARNVCASPDCDPTTARGRRIAPRRAGAPAARNVNSTHGGIHS